MFIYLIVKHRGHFMLKSYFTLTLIKEHFPSGFSLR